jgi:4-amino-4-deoxy-L-arabinose transferase-like glycosyltransferase
MVLALSNALFGERLLAARLLLALVGTGGCALVYFLGKELFDPQVGIVACLLAAVSPTFVVFSVLLLSETLFATGLVASLLGFARLVQKTATANETMAAMLTGLACGLATLVRPTWLPVGAFFAAYLVARKKFAPAAVLLAALAVTLAPWVIRNLLVTGRLVVTTLWVGPSLFDGLNPHATGASDMQFVESDGLYRQMSEYDADRHYRLAAWKFASQNPGRAIALGFKKLGRFWNVIPNAEQFAQPVVRLGVAGFTIPALALALVGAWSVRTRRTAWLVPLVPILFFSAVHFVFVGSLRYRLPAEYPLMVLTAAGLLKLAPCIRSLPLWPAANLRSREAAP